MRVRLARSVREGGRRRRPRRAGGGSRGLLRQRWAAAWGCGRRARSPSSTARDHRHPHRSAHNRGEPWRRSRGSVPDAAIFAASVRASLRGEVLRAAGAGGRQILVLARRAHLRAKVRRGRGQGSAPSASQMSALRPLILFGDFPGENPRAHLLPRADHFTPQVRRHLRSRKAAAPALAQLPARRRASTATSSARRTSRASRSPSRSCRRRSSSRQRWRPWLPANATLNFTLLAISWCSC